MQFPVPFSFLKRRTIKPAFFLFTILLINQPKANAQVWTYDFGNSTGSYATTGVSNAFLPAAASGTTLVSVGSGGGSMDLLNPGSSVGSLSELQLTASSNTSVNKAGIFDFEPGLTGYTRINMQLSNGTSGNWYFYVGNGASFSNDQPVNTGEAYSGMRWSIDNGGNVTTSIRSSGGWSNLPANSFVQGQNYVVEIYTNNAGDALYYQKGDVYEIAVGTADIWVNNVLLGDDISSIGLASLQNIDSWMVYGENSTSNTARFHLDNITYTNDMTLKVLPVKFSRVRAVMVQQHNQVSFDNLTESSILQYTLERSSNGSQFAALSKINPNRNNGTTASYVITDASPLAGTNFYRIKAVEIDGRALYSDIVRINRSSTKAEALIYPNPVTGKAFTMELSNLPKGKYALSVFDAGMKEAFSQVINHSTVSLTEQVRLPVTLLSGVYYFRISGEQGVLLNQLIMVH